MALPTFPRGKKIRGKDLDAVVERGVRKSAIGSQDVAVKRINDQGAIENTKRSPIPRSGSNPFLVAASKGALPSATAPKLGYVTSTGRYYVRVGSDWICISHWETS